MKPTIIPQELSIKKPFFWGIAAIAIALLTLASFWGKLPPQVPLFFSKPRGETQLGETFMLLVPLGISLVLLFINSVFAQRLGNYPLLARIIILGATTGCILAAITVVRIIFLIL